VAFLLEMAKSLPILDFFLFSTHPYVRMDT